MQIDVRYQPSYSLAILRLEQNEAIQAEAGAMVSMTANMTVDTQMKGGLLGAVTRTVLGGETLFANTFRAEGGPGEITLAPALPGDVTAVQMRGETMLAYAAGVVDGEGFISIKRHGPKCLRLMVGVANTSRDVVEWLRINFDGSYTRQKPKVSTWKPVYYWRLYDTKAGVFLKMLSPYLIIKARQAELGVAFMSIWKGRDTRIPTDEVMAQAIDIRNRLWTGRSKRFISMTVGEN